MIPQIRVTAMRHGPVITPDMLPGDDGANINGPSLISMPDWVPGRLGAYYLYFAHHMGTYIRLAYSDSLHGPWRIHPGGVPLLVTLDSPQREVSSTHLELSMVGAAIVASDTRSTNGSVLRVPGAAPRTLIGGESVVVIPGTVIELGDGNLIELLGPDSGPDQDPASADSTGARP